MPTHAVRLAAPPVRAARENRTGQPHFPQRSLAERARPRSDTVLIRARGAEQASAHMTLSRSPSIRSAPAQVPAAPRPCHRNLQSAPRRDRDRPHASGPHHRWRSCGRFCRWSPAAGPRGRRHIPIYRSARAETSEQGAAAALGDVNIVTCRITASTVGKSVEEVVIHAIWLEHAADGGRHDRQREGRRAGRAARPRRWAWKLLALLREP